MAHDPYSRDRKVKNKPDEPTGSTLGGSTANSVVGHDDEGGGLLARIASMVESLLEKVGRTKTPEPSSLSGAESRGVFKGGYNDQGEWETGSQRKARARRDRGESVVSSQMGDNRGDVEQSASDASASVNAGRIRREKRAAARACGADEPEAVDDDANPGGVRWGDEARGDDDEGGDTDERLQRMEQKLEDLAQMVLGIPESTVKALMDG